MNFDLNLRPEVVTATLLILLPMLFAALWPERFAALGRGMPGPVRIALPGLLGLPYALVAEAFKIFHWGWLAVYALLPVAIAFVLGQARAADKRLRGNWRDFAILAVLGVAVDLRWFEPAWPHGLTALGKMLLLDAGIYGFLAVRQLDGVGFDLRMKARDVWVGVREFLIYAAIAIPLGFWLGFLHVHSGWPDPLRALAAFVFTFLFIAIPEELFFRGWLQNLLERRMGRIGSLVVTAVIFGLAHWNKRTTSFNWRYVVIAAVAGVFYGRAWRADRRVGASALTHSTVDTVWSLLLR
jgi:membrane protease YdiL (CAAX protease family)